ncbi:MAG: lysophospholipid acyltransferase family protein [Acidobacteriota bacterium]
MNRLLQIDKLERLCGSARARGEFSRELLSELNVDIKVTGADLEKIPRTGGVIAVSNHPFGLLDGAILTDLLTRLRPDFRVLTNHLLSELPEIARHAVFIDPFGRPESRGANSRGLKQALMHVKRGGMLLIFPAGEVSHFNFRSGAIRDPRWHSTAARLVRLTGARVLPILIRGANGIPFQLLGMVHPRLRTAALPAELLNKRGRAVEVRIGALIQAARIEALPGDEAAIRYLRLRTDLLARRGLTAIQTVDAPANGAAPKPAGEIAREVAGLPAQCLLEQARDLEVYLADAPRIPLVLEEIGRLREVTFRAAGEGTGKPADLDRFDPHYLHLFVWNREKRESVGAYRVGDVPRLLARFGRKGLYTDSLFRFRAGFVENLGPAFEMGRSFIRPEYQRQFAPLMLLWKGIGVYVSRRPEYSTLIGAVSVSNQYTRTSRELIARFFERKALLSDQGTVKARRPLRGNFVEKRETQALCSLLPDVEDLSAPIADLEPDGKGIPILVRQYVKLGGRLLAFSVDPQFGNTLDGFVRVDLRQTAPEILSRYMGKDGARDFLSWHAAITPRVA